MYTIKHIIKIKTGIDKVHEAISTMKGLSSWWTVQTSGDFRLNGTVDFRFSDKFHIRMMVIELEKDYIRWECLKAEPDWIGTTITFELEEDTKHTTLRFFHAGWPTHGDFFAHCNLSWAKYLFSLKDYLESGRGRPYVPD